MSNTQKITVPDIGDSAEVSLVEILVNVGDTVAVDDPIVTLEGDKASMEVPSPVAGVVTSIDCQVNDMVAQGSHLISIETTQTPQADTKTATAQAAPSTPPTPNTSDARTSVTTIPMPDLGGADEVSVIEIHVAAGQTVAVDDPLITLEGDKASMEVPSPYAGTIQSLHVNVGDQVGPNDPIGEMICAANETAASDPAPKSAAPSPAPAAKPMPAASPVGNNNQGQVYASPSVRRLAHALEVDLQQVTSTGRKGRITRDDLYRWLKTRLNAPAAPGSSYTAPEIDFSKFGDIERQSLNKIKRLTGTHVHRSWSTIPHVTQFDEADITEMEAFRKAHKEEAAAQGIKLTPIVFVMKAVVAALAKFPHFNASLSPQQDEVILKKYFNIGVAVDTPNGLVVPVIRDVEKKSLYQLSDELIKISKKAREKSLAPKDMQGGCFTISSLGGIGGTAFTPIVNAPEVAILGLSKASMQPVYQNNDFVPRLMLPLSLSYDHRVIDGADGARFTQYLAKCLGDIRTLLL